MFLGSLFQVIHPPYHFSCDNTFKEYLIQQWIEQGRLDNTLVMPRVPDWATSLWKLGNYPLETPFVHDGKIVFPPFFMALTLPFYLVMGFWGLFALPLASVVGLWGMMWWHLDRRGYGPLSVNLALAMTIFSPLTFYGAIFWEHAPSIFFLFATYMLLVGTGSIGRISNLHSFCAGASWIAALAFRPEIILGFIFLGALAWKTLEARRAFALGAGLLGLLVAALNFIATGHPLGIHHQQASVLFTHPIFDIVTGYFSLYSMDLLLITPATFLALLFPLIARRHFFPNDQGERTLLLTFWLTFFFSFLFIPNFGDAQIYRRFILLVVPAGALLAARLAFTNRTLGMALAALQFASVVNLYYIRDEFAWNYSDRVRYIHEALEHRRPGAVISDHNDGMLNHFPLAQSTPFFRVHGFKDMQRAISRIAPHVPPEKLLFVMIRRNGESSQPLDRIQLADGSHWRFRPLPSGRSHFQIHVLVSDELSKREVQ